MTVNKALPTFYVIDLEGDAADLEFLLGTKHRIQSITISSGDFGDDVSATNGGLDALAFLRRKLEFAAEEENVSFNPEFFPSQPQIEPTLQMLIEEQIAEEAIEQIEEEKQRLAFPMTRRFDEWGDFVVAKAHASNFYSSIRMKVAVHPQKYFEEKSLQLQEHQAYLQGQKYQDAISIIH